MQGLITDHRYEEAYDTGRYYIEHCWELDNWHKFLTITSANQSRDTSSNRYSEYREWLKSVLYLNTSDSNWYCADADAMLATFKKQAFQIDYNSQLAVERYLMGSGKCPEWEAAWKKGYMEGRLGQRQIWQDTVTVDTNLYPLDTTLPSLKSLGLEILLGPQETAKRADAGFTIRGLHTTQNPFSHQTEIAFELGDRELMQLKVYDVLGRVVYDNGIGTVLEAGERSFVLNGSTWPASTYYARLSGRHGILQTVKLQVIR